MCTRGASGCAPPTDHRPDDDKPNARSPYGDWTVSCVCGTSENVVLSKVRFDWVEGTTDVQGFRAFIVSFPKDGKEQAPYKHATALMHGHVAGNQLFVARSRTADGIRNVASLLFDVSSGNGNSASSATEAKVNVVNVSGLGLPTCTGDLNVTNLTGNNGGSTTLTFSQPQQDHDSALREIHGAGVYGIGRFVDDGKRFAAALVFLWDPEAPKPHLELAHYDLVQKVDVHGTVLSSSGTTLALGSETIRKYVITSRADMIAALNEAAGLEQMLMLQYLYAAVSLKDHPDDFVEHGDLKYELAEMVRQWKYVILDVAHQEMRHLAYATNLLVAVGGSPNFHTANFPMINGYFQTVNETDDNLIPVPMSLRRFDLKTIEHMIRLEAQGPEDVTEPVTAEQPPPPGVAMLAAFSEAAAPTPSPAPSPRYYNSVADLYIAVLDFLEKHEQDGIINIVDQTAPAVSARKTTTAGGRPTNVPWKITSLEDARIVVRAIIEQGEGSTGNDPNSHLVMFRRLYIQYKNRLEQLPTFEPCRNIVSNPYTRPTSEVYVSNQPNPPSTFQIGEFVDDGLQYRAARLLNGAYMVMVRWLHQLYSNTASAEERPAVESLVYMPYMTEVIMPLCEALARIPTKLEDADPRFIGPTFELPTNVNIQACPTSASVAVSLEFLRDLHAEAVAVHKLAASKPDQLHALVLHNLSHVATNLRLLHDEFDARVKSKSSVPYPTESLLRTYSESPDVPAPDATGPYPWPPAHYIELTFSGWAISRLASDPDGAAVLRGCSGNVFAYDDEPDLDRIIRLQVPDDERIRKEKTVPKINVKVRSAKIVAAAAPEELPLPDLLGAKVSLEPVSDRYPKFEGMNHIVSPDGEPIDPFVMRVCTEDEQFCVQRGVGSGRDVPLPPLLNMSPFERWGTGRYPVPGSLQANDTSLAENVAAINKAAVEDGSLPFPMTADGTPDIDAYVQRRYTDLKEEHAKPDVSAARRVILERRMSELENLYKRNIRRTRFYFSVSYDHLLSGPDVTSILPETISQQYSVDSDTRWRTEYTLGCYDSDALSFFMRGRLMVPLRKNEATVGMDTAAESAATAGPQGKRGRDEGEEGGEEEDDTAASRETKRARAGGGLAAAADN